MVWYPHRVPALRHHRHEALAVRRVRDIALGESQAASYRAVGYRARGHAGYVNASRLLRRADVAGRIAELQHIAARKSVATVASISNELDAARALAFATGNAMAGVKATMGKARIHGLLVNRSERGKPESFQAKTVDEIAADMIEQIGEQSALELVGALLGRLERQHTTSRSL